MLLVFVMESEIFTQIKNLNNFLNKNETFENRFYFDLTTWLLAQSPEEDSLTKLAFLSRVNRKTIKRLLLEKRSPNALTTIRLYRTFLNVSTLKDFYKKTPQIILNKVKNNPNLSEERGFFSKHIKIQNLPSFEDKILACSIFRKILAYTAASNINRIDRSFIAFKFGEEGLKTLEIMLEMNILIEKDSHILIHGNCPEIINDKSSVFSRMLVNEYYHDNKLNYGGENYNNFLIEGLNADGLNEWIKIDEESFIRKSAIANKSEYQGTARAWTACHTDTLDTTLINVNEGL